MTHAMFETVGFIVAVVAVAVFFFTVSPDAVIRRWRERKVYFWRTVSLVGVFYLRHASEDPEGADKFRKKLEIRICAAERRAGVKWRASGVAGIHHYKWMILPPKE